MENRKSRVKLDYIETSIAMILTARNKSICSNMRNQITRDPLINLHLLRLGILQTISILEGQGNFIPSPNTIAAMHGDKCR